MNNFLEFFIGPILEALISLITEPLTTYFIVLSEFGKVSMLTVIPYAIKFNLIKKVEFYYDQTMSAYIKGNYQKYS